MSKANLFALCHGEEKLRVSEPFLRYRILDGLLSYRYRRYTMNDLLDALNYKLGEYDAASTPIVRRTLEKDLSFLEDESGLDVELSREKIDGKQYISYKDKNLLVKPNEQSQTCLSYVMAGKSCA